MNRLVTSLIAFVLILGCDRQESVKSSDASGNTGQANPTPAAPNPSDGLKTKAVPVAPAPAAAPVPGPTKEAEEHVKTAFAKLYRECDDSYFRKLVNKDQGSVIVQQYKNVVFTVKAKEPTEADRLNNVKFRCAFYVDTDLYRGWEQYEGIPGKWSDWGSNSGSLWYGTMEKRGSDWFIDGQRLVDWLKARPQEPMPCNEIPLVGSAPQLDADLRRAVVANDVNRVKALLSQGANMHLLVETGEVGHQGVKEKLAPLHLAVKLRKTQVVEAFLAHGADLNLEMVKGGGAPGVTPWFLAFTSPHPPEAKIIQLMLNRGADPNASLNGGQKPLHLSKTEDIVALLVKKGADVNATNDEGTPLHMCAFLSEDTVRAFIKFGANVNVADKRRKTPLHVVATYGTLKSDRDNPTGISIATLLLDAGAEINAKDKDGITPVGAARKEHGAKQAYSEKTVDRSAMIDFLTARGGK